MEKHVFKDNADRKRYELDLGGGSVASISYAKPAEGVIELLHTQVPYEFENQGIGSELVRNCLEAIREQGCKVIPSCAFVASYLRRHPEWKELIADRE